MGKSIDIALIQCTILKDEKEMSNNIRELVEQAAENNPDLIVLPERWRPLPDTPNKDKVSELIQDERGKDYGLIKSLANKFSVNIISGGIWEKRPHNESSESSNSKFWNFITSYLFNSKGQEIGRQDKIHLYNFEPIIFEPGSQLHIFSLEELDVKLAILICFDIAFYETPRAAVENGAEILISPTLIREEGLYNWNIYLQARALENRVPVAACNPIGDFFGRHFPGKSKIISFKVGSESPAVLKVKEAPKNQQFIISEKINLSFPNRIREKRLAEKIDIKKIIIKKK